MPQRHGPIPTHESRASAALVGRATEDRASSSRRFRVRTYRLASRNEIDIVTVSGQRAYRIDLTLVSLSMVLKDTRGNEIVRLQDNVTQTGDMMSIHRCEEKIAVVKKIEVDRDESRYIVKIRGANDLLLQGDVRQHTYRIERNGFPIATVSRDWPQVHDGYGVDVAPGEDAALILAIVICANTLAQQRLLRPRH